ncbi:hypothetical protein ACPEIF_13100 [Streptomyces sp. NPDC012600]|uniref:hypothetical protein n=1 Tax=unclassified Streptomyces TaxID=2593676 RepID=UPI0036BE2AC9
MTADQREPVFQTPSAVETDISLAVIEYGDAASAYAPAMSAPGVPQSVVDDYAIVVDVLALARRVPLPDVPPLLAVGTRALLRVHRGLLG